MGLDEIRNLKNQAQHPKVKSKYTIPKFSKKRIAQIKANKEAAAENPGIESEMEQWFQMIRLNLTGVCQCGCGNPSSKFNDEYFRFSCCHLFPKAIFETIKTHPLNYVERAFFGGCHDNFDRQGMDKWVCMEDWQDIKYKFTVLSPLLTKEEKATKFYSQFEKLVNEN